MVSIIKNQLLKHLSRFTKNLSADKINLSTFKGEGELKDLELDELVLTELLELPSWLRLKSALCNKVIFRIQWTQLKKVPIQLNLDEVEIVVETSEELRSPAAQEFVTAVPGKYSFIHKIIDGISVRVNTVNINFNSPAFTANVQVSRIVVESKSPKWESADLRMTRMKEPNKGHLLIFKELVWQTVRIEAKSIVDKNLTPLRLLTNQAKCRFVIKKRLSDSFILGSRLVIILDDLLWVLTDSQLKAALHFLDSLAGLIQKSTQLSRKTKAARKLEELPEYRAQLSKMPKAKENNSELSKLFSSCDVIETSYHFLSHQIVLHLCDDDDGPGRSSHPNLKNGGALQISLSFFQVDFYPYHLAQADRNHWPKYREASVSPKQWQEQSLAAFRSKFLDLIDKNKVQHTPLSRANKGNENSTPTTEQYRRMSAPLSPSSIKSTVMDQLSKLMTTCVIMRIDDFTIYKVTTSGRKQSLKEFISGDRDHMNLPPDTKMVHAEFIYYYYPDEIPLPLPPPKFFVEVNPIQVVFDIDSCLWLNAFALNLYESLQSSKQDISGSNLTYIDVKIQAILPRIVFESGTEYYIQKDRPKSLVFQVTRATITNVRSLEHSSRADLAKCVDSFHMGSLFFGSDFPSKPNDFYIVTQKFLDHISTKDNIRSVVNDLDTSSYDVLMSQLSREYLWIEAKDVWCINLDPVWAEFQGASACNKPVPFLDAVPITIWMHSHLDPNSTIDMKSNDSKYADVHALAYISNLVSLQLNHYQYLFLLRLVENVSELATFLSIDTDKIIKIESNSSLVVGALIPQLEMTFVMPTQSPGKESSGADVESFIPDSSSIADDILQGGSTATVWPPDLYRDMLIKPISNSWETTKKLTPMFECELAEPIFFDAKNLSPTLGNCQTYDYEVIDSKSDQKVTQQSFPNIPNNFNAGISTMRKGFTNLMSSIDTALKPNIDDASDTMSIRSDASSDSDNYIMINLSQEAERNIQAIDAMFHVPEFQTNSKVTIELASEVIEDTSTITTVSDHSLTSSAIRKDLVSVVTFKLNKVEFLQQALNNSSSMKIQVSSITNEECSSIPWDEFQGKFSSRTRAWAGFPSNTSTSTQVKLRIDHDLAVPLNQANITSKDILKDIFKNYIDIQICDLELNLMMSSIIGLTDLIEDEIIPIAIPTQLIMKNIQLQLMEDRPPANITSPSPVPLNLNIHELLIHRSEDGVFHLVTKSSDSEVYHNDSNSNHQINNQLKIENEELRRRLLAFERISEENHLLRRSKEEAESLKSALTSSQEKLSRLLYEKQKLLDELENMKKIMQNDQGRQWLSKR